MKLIESRGISLKGTLTPCYCLHISSFTMALPKSMRYLAGATICVLVFLFVQILKAPAGEVVVPSKIPLSKDGEWDHDPQSDRTCFPTLQPWRD
jgi:hypothetical protein